jgi:hypothetical protein
MVFINDHRLALSTARNGVHLAEDLDTADIEAPGARSVFRLA